MSGKKWFNSLVGLFFLCLPMALQCVEAQDLTYKRLIKVPCTDHIQHFRKLFKSRKISHFMEYGLGYGTKFYLDNCDQVTSVELIAQASNVKWMHLCEELYANEKNWNLESVDIRDIPILNASLEKARNRIDPTTDPKYCAAVNRLVESTLNGKDVDLVFVDCGFHSRADIVSALFGRVKIIAAHDTNMKNKFAHSYGWPRIVTPDSYERIHFSTGKGVTFWIHKDFSDLIEDLKKY